MPESFETDRREAFRLEMSAYVNVANQQSDITEPVDYFRELEALALSSEYSSLKQELILVSDRIKDLSSKKSIDILSKQLDVLSKLQMTQSLVEQSLNSQSISISEGGCSASVEMKLSPGDTIALAIVFAPNYFSLFVFAEVITIDSSDSRTHFKFTQLSERQRQQLLKTMFQAQTDAKNR